MGSEGFETKKIFVGGIPRTVNEGEFGTFFSHFGEIKEHRIIRDHSTGGSRGFGFITFQTEQAVDDLLGMGNKLDFAGAQVELRVLQRETREAMPGRYNRLPICFYLLKQSRCWYDDPTFIISETSIAATRNTMICLSYIDHRGGYAELMARHLSIMGIPQEEQPIILEKLFQAIQVALPLRCMHVLIADITARLLGGFDDHDTIDRLTRGCPDLQLELEYPSELCFETHAFRHIDYHNPNTGRIAWESFQTPRVTFVPATRSSIQILQKVRLDSLDEETIKQQPTCSICKDEFDEGGADQLIIPLPCAHHYHLNCIVRWLEMSHLCPLCRYPLPTVEEGEAKIV